ncbi:hypothetical protein [Paractinoplanes ferrugineus]|uniref:hypothetical protein n=1 Tax=Paractinoplanes ferrugineus TaxID=113564 RepID=UPI001943558D|nr:hypothetical protein [Actinoplanes ferrugineus]
MSTLADKLDKQFDYQRTLYATSGDAADLFVEVDYLTAYFAQQTRQEPARLRRQVKVELERRADAGEVRRWLDVHGSSLRADRVDHYFIAEQA